MIKLIVVGAAAVASLVPAAAGLAGNPSFSHEVAVPTSHAGATVDDHGRGGGREAEPGDDRRADGVGTRREAEPGDDKGGAGESGRHGGGADDGPGHH